MLELSKEIRIAYFHVDSPVGTRYITVAVHRSGTGDHTVAFAFYSPNIEKAPFTKSMGRTIALTRLEREHGYISISLNDDSVPNIAYEALRQLADRMAVLNSHKLYPSWIVRAMRQGRVKAGLTKKH